jgi:sialidase-1
MSIYSDCEVITICKANETHSRQSEGAIVELKDGTLLLAWMCFGTDGHDEGTDTISMMNSVDGGRTWDNYRVVVEPGKGFRNVYSPSLFRAKNGDVLLFYMKVYQPESYHTDSGGTLGGAALSAGYIARSIDEGKTFGEPWIIWDKRPFSTASSSMRRLRNGRLILPCEHHEGRFYEETPEMASWSAGEKIHVRPGYSDDDGKAWIFYNQNISLPMRGAMEPSVAELDDGRLIMVMRNQMGSLFKSYSENHGETWSKPQTTGLRIPESCPCVSNIPDSDKILVIWNNSEYDMHHDHFGVRYPLTVAISGDGVTFTDFWDIETERRLYSNPGVAWTEDGVCLVNYWTCVYNRDEKWGSTGPIDLRLARFRVKI